MSTVDPLTVSSPRVPLPSLCRVVTLLAFTAVLSSFAQPQSGSPNPRPPWVVVDAPPPVRYGILVSPQIVVLDDGTYVVSHQQTGHYSASVATYVCRSRDRGATWERVATVGHAASASLVPIGGRLHLIGVEAFGRGRDGRPFVLTSSDGGATWTTARDEATGLIRGDGSLATAAASAIVDDGRVWVPFWRSAFVDGESTTYARVASAPAASDWTSSSSWRWSDEFALQRSAYGAFLTRVGDDLILALQGYGRTEITATGRVASSGWSLRRHSAGTLEITLPSDGASTVPRAVGLEGQIGMLTRPASPLSDSEEQSFGHTLAWSVSDDRMKSWNARTLLLHEPDPKGVVFGWSEWAVDGEDLLVVSCAWIREGGTAERPARRAATIFLRVPKFRERTPQTPPLWGQPFDARPAPAASTDAPTPK